MSTPLRPELEKLLGSSKDVFFLSDSKESSRSIKWDDFFHQQPKSSLYLIGCYADWCGPCHRYYPQVATLIGSSEWQKTNQPQKIRILLIESDQLDPLKKKNQWPQHIEVRGFPSLFAWQDNKGLPYTRSEWVDPTTGILYQRSIEVLTAIAKGVPISSLPEQKSSDMLRGGHKTMIHASSSSSSSKLIVLRYDPSMSNTPTTELIVALLKILKCHGYQVKYAKQQYLTHSPQLEIDGNVWKGSDAMSKTKKLVNSMRS